MSSRRRGSSLQRFATAAARDAFCASELFREWECEVAPLSEGVARRENVSGMETWFTVPGRSIVSPPRWKMAVVTLAAVYPMSLMMPFVLKPLINSWPRWAGALAVAAGIVISLTWMVMPALARLLRRWLYVRPGKQFLA